MVLAWFKLRVPFGDEPLATASATPFDQLIFPFLKAWMYSFEKQDVGHIQILKTSSVKM
jgi:hypothetical protein